MSKKASDPYLVCPLCGFEFHKHDALCEHGCPLASMCNLARCPSCHYEFPEPAQSVSWFRRLFGGGRRGAALVPNGLRTLRSLAPGDEGEVVAVVREASGRDTLSTFGLVPGATVHVVQHQPACVVRVGETELALDPEIAELILMRAAAA